MTYSLAAVKRGDVKVSNLRATGNIPAVLYGAGNENVSLTLSYKDFFKVYEKASESSLIDLNIDGTAAGKVLIQEVQFEPVSGRAVHLDLRRIDMSKPLIVNVELNFLGEAPAVKELGGTLIKNVNEVEVKCLPADLVEHIDVSLESLKTFDDAIEIKDLVLPPGITILSPNLNDMVATASPALTEEQIKAMEEENTQADVSKIEVAGKKEEPAEGEESEDSKGDAKPEDKKE